MDTQQVRDYVTQKFQRASFSQRELSREKKVVVFFHGHTNSARHTRPWKKFVNTKVCGIHLNAPFPYKGGGYEWFSYLEDEPAEPRSGFGDLPSLMRGMKLLRAKDCRLEESVRRVVRLFAMLSRLGKEVSFVGTSQGAAVAFLAGLDILKRGGDFKGGFFHHMAGYYDDVAPLTDVLVIAPESSAAGGVQSKRMRADGEDTHSTWLRGEQEALNKFLAGEKNRLVVCLSKDDKVVPLELGRFLKSARRRFKEPPPCKLKSLRERQT